MNKCDVCPFSYLDDKGKFKCKWKICMLEFDDEMREQVYNVLIKAPEETEKAQASMWNDWFKE